MVRSQRGDALAAPTIAVTGFETVAIENASDQIVVGDQCQLAYGRDDISWSAVALSAPAPGQADLTVNAARPVDDDGDLRSRGVDIGHDLVDQGAHDALFQPCVRRRLCPDRLQICAKEGERGRVDSRRRGSGLMGRDLALDFGDAGERLVPARLEFASHQPVGWIGGVILSESAVSGIACCFKVAAESLARLISSLVACSAAAIDAAMAPGPTTPRNPRSRRRHAGLRMQCNVARRCPSSRAYSCNVGSDAERRYSGASACVRSGGSGSGRRARRRHAWAHHDACSSGRCWRPSCGSLRTSPSSHSPRGRRAAAQASRRAPSGGSSHRRPWPRTLSPRPFYHRHRRRNTWFSSADKAPRASRLMKGSVKERTSVTHAARSNIQAGISSIARPPIRPKCNGKRRHQPCRSPNERRRRTRTTDEAYTEAPYKRSYVRSRTSLYNDVRRHSSLGGKRRHQPRHAAPITPSSPSFRHSSAVGHSKKHCVRYHPQPPRGCGAKGRKAA
jgi:hypothetical protein